MAKPTTNEIIAWAVEKHTFSKNDIMAEFNMNRFEAHGVIAMLTKQGVINDFIPSPFQKSDMQFVSMITLAELKYLGIDISQIDFETTTLEDAKNAKIEEKMPKREGLGSVGYYGPSLYAVDNEKLRMRCGELKTGDCIRVSRSESYEHHYVPGLTRQDFWGYEFRYNERREMQQTEDGIKYTWVKDESMNGWGVGQVGQETQFNYNNNDVDMAFSPPDMLLGKPVVNVDFLFAQTKGSPTVTIPETVTSMKGICYHSGTHRTLNIPAGVENVESAFEGCWQLEIISKISPDVAPKFQQNMFVNCQHLTQEEIDKLPASIDRTVAVIECGGKVISDRGVLSGKEDTTIDEQEQNLELSRAKSGQACHLEDGWEDWANSRV